MPLAGVCVVECAQVSAPSAAGSDSSTASTGPPSTTPSGHAFQVAYREDGQEYTLYLVASRDAERHDWIRTIRGGECLLSPYRVHSVPRGPSARPWGPTPCPTGVPTN